MSDDIYEQSAAQALRVAQQAGRATEGGLAEEKGFRANSIQDGEMDDSWRNKGAVGAPSDVQSREMMENRQAVQARRAIEQSGELSMDDLLDLGMGDGGAVAQEAAQLKRKMAAVAGHMVDQGARQVVNDAYMDPNEASMMMEAEAYQPQSFNDGWQVAKKSAQLASGKRIPVFVVEDSLSGMTTGKRYRLAEVANKVARVVNATNNPNDPRVQMIDKAYDQHVKLMQEKARARKAGNSSKMRMIESKLEEVNARLGLG